MLRSSRGKETAQNKRKVDQTRFAFSGATAAICGTFAAIASIPTIPDPGGTLLASSMVQPRPSDGPRSWTAQNYSGNISKRESADARLGLGTRECAKHWSWDIFSRRHSHALKSA
jgi:hypothetical protein